MLLSSTDLRLQGDPERKRGGPLIFISAKSLTEDKIEGLLLGPMIIS